MTVGIVLTAVLFSLLAILMLKSRVNSGIGPQGRKEAALSALREFLGKLDTAGVSPLDSNLRTNAVVVLRWSENAHDLTCRLLIDQQWIATYHKIPRSFFASPFEGITYFGQTGPNNPCRAISGGDTNRLSELHVENPMSASIASRLLRQTLERILRRPVADPEVFPEKAFNYDLGQWCGRWWKPNESRHNQLNVMYRITLKATGSNAAILVVYSDGVAGLN